MKTRIIRKTADINKGSAKARMIVRITGTISERGTLPKTKTIELTRLATSTATELMSTMTQNKNN